ncbi:hypothetical protein BS17DRAFT_96469 [Gyrodon lividus]|nr:hypothetical protein BS17DRAFT_96469 [Gyrodon lividus]
MDGECVCVCGVFHSSTSFLCLLFVDYAHRFVSWITSICSFFVVIFLYPRIYIPRGLTFSTPSFVVLSLVLNLPCLILTFVCLLVLDTRIMIPMSSYFSLERDFLIDCLLLLRGTVGDVSAIDGTYTSWSRCCRSRTVYLEVCRS